MGYRRFTDPEGNEWEVRDFSKAAWEFHPVADNPGRITRIDPPGYESDPFEMSEEELQRLLGRSGDTGRSRPPKSPFRD